MEKNEIAPFITFQFFTRTHPKKTIQKNPSKKKNSIYQNHKKTNALQNYKTRTKKNKKYLINDLKKKLYTILKRNEDEH